MKKFISIILAACIVSALVPCALASELSPSFVIYEDFNYGIGEKLNTADGADEADEEKGFAGGWCGNIGLTAAPDDKYIIAGGGLLNAVPAGSTTIARKTDSNINLAEDGIYVISWDMLINENAAVSDNTRTQKLLLTSEGITENKSQLQFGFACGRANGAAPYMRLMSGVYYDENTSVDTGVLYHLAVMINSSAASEDEISYMIYADGSTVPDRWNLISKASIDSSFDVLGYMQYTGGSSGNNSFGNLFVEGYGADGKKYIENVISLISSAEESLSADILSQADEKISAIADGTLKNLLSNTAETVKEKIEAETEQIKNIYHQMEDIVSAEVTAENKDEIQAKINDVSQLISEIKNPQQQALLNEDLEKLKADFTQKVNAAAAEAAVEKAEKTEDAADIEDAAELVNALNASEEKTELLGRLNALQKKIAGKVAGEKVAEAEKMKTAQTLAAAKEWINALDEGTEKASLSERLKAVEEYINSYVPSVKGAVITGVTELGESLAAEYSIEDLCGNLRSVSVSWYICGSENGVYTKLEISGNSIRIISDYGGRYIKAVITVENTAGKTSDTETAPVYIQKRVIMAYDNFDYAAGEALNSSHEATEPDSVKGFASGWCGGVDLSTSAADNYITVGNGLVESVSSKSTGIYRKLSEKIDFSTDGVYLLAWDMCINDRAPSADNTRTQKFLLTNTGVGTGTSQLQFGFAGGRTNGFAPYMRLTSSLYYDDITEIRQGVLYHFIVIIEASENGSDNIKLMLYADGENISDEWSMEQELSSNGSFEIVGYQEYVGGSNKNAFGNFVAEKYSSADKNSIKNIGVMLYNAKSSMSAELLDNAVKQIDGFPEGTVKKVLKAQAAQTASFIESENERINQIKEEIESLNSASVTVSNAESIMSRFSAAEEEIKLISSESIRNSLNALLETAQKGFQAKLINVSRSTEKFSYTQGDDISSVSDDEANGWSSEYFSDKDMTSPAQGATLNSGSISLTDSVTLYRRMSYPIETEFGYTTYLKSRFKLENGGKVHINIGDFCFRAGKGADISFGGSQAPSDILIESGREYTAVIELAENEAVLHIFPSDGYYDGQHDAKISYGGVLSDVIGFGGENAVIYEVTKENTGLLYTSASETALKTLLSDISQNNIDTAKNEIEKLENSIFKVFAAESAEGISCEWNKLPSAQNLSIIGAGKPNSTLEAYYVIDDTEQSLERTDISWYCGDTLIAYGKTCRVSAAYSGKYLYFTVKVTNKAGRESEEYQSPKLFIAGEAIGSGGSSGGGGSGAARAGSYSLPAQLPFAADESDNSESGSAFADISGHWAEQIIIRMAEKGIVNGISDTEFAPDRHITRAEFTALIARALGLPVGENPGFNDIDEDDWYYTSVAAAYSYGIINGWDGKFYPGSLITREEMTKIIVTAAEKAKPIDGDNDNDVFLDEADISDWSVSYIRKAAAAGLVSGGDDGRFLPKNSTTRAEAVTVLERLMNLLGTD